MKDAIIVTGLLRLFGFNREYFHELSKKSTLFFITNKSESENIKFMPKKNTFIYYIEDYAQELSLQEKYLSLDEGTKILQWQKLDLGLKLLLEKEKELGIKYNRIFKIRTDLDFHKNYDLTKLTCKKNTLYMNSDYYFGGERDVFIKASSFYEHLQEYYENYNFKPFSMRHIEKCDYDCAKFKWLFFPESIRNKYSKFEDLAKHEFHKDNISFKKIDKGFSFRKNYKKIKFPSEVAFLHFLLNKNLILKNFEFQKLTLLEFRENKELDFINYNNDEMDNIFKRNVEAKKLTLEEILSIVNYIKRHKKTDNHRKEELEKIIKEQKKHLAILERIFIFIKSIN